MYKSPLMNIHSKGTVFLRYILIILPATDKTTAPICPLRVVTINSTHMYMYMNQTALQDNQRARAIPIVTAAQPKNYTFVHKLNKAKTSNQVL